VERERRPVIGFLTDFGLDGAAATCRGVMLGICRDAQIIDICHTVRKYSVADGSFILTASLPYLPAGVHVGVVDPGVGTPRRPVAIRAQRGDILVGPDNGLLVAPAESLGGVDAIRQLENRTFWLTGTSATFHGRDVFAPVAGHLSVGDATFEELGPTLAPDDLVRLEAPQNRVAAGVLETAVAYVDSFGNIRLACGPEDLARAFGVVEPGASVVAVFHPSEGPERRDAARFVTTFGQVESGSALLYVDSSGRLAYADNQGDAAARLGAGTGTAVRITRAIDRAET
jgi:S-adenosylmethionine hydrolase